MKVALCMSGQPRFLERCFPSIKKNVIDVNSPDVFLHTWSYEGESEPYKYGGDGGWKDQRIASTDHERAIEMYQPLRHQVDNSQKFYMPSVSLTRGLDFYSPGTDKEAEEAGMTRDDYEKFLLSNCLSMWSSIHKSFQLLHEYTLETGIEYDAVVRCRFDVEVNTPLLMSSFDQRYMYAIEMGKQYGHIADWINFSSYANMMVYSSTYLHYRKIYDDIEASNSHPICNEMALAANLARNGVQCVNLPINASLPRL